MKKLCAFVYYFVAYNLPSSFVSFGMMFNKIRILLLKQMCTIGEKNKIQRRVYVGMGKYVTIGNFCQINENVKLSNCDIGDYVMIAPGVTILGRMHQYKSINEPMILQGEIEVKKTIIENDVWIGTNAIIMPGLRISTGSIIGAGCVLTKDTIPYGVYGGVPAKLIKIRDSDN